MPMESVWENDQRSILHTMYSGIWTWSELHHHNRTVVEPLLQASASPVAMILNMSEAFWVMPGSVLQNLKRSILNYAHYDIDIIVFVSELDGVRALMETVHRRFGAKDRIYLVARTSEEAKEIIHQYRVGV